MIMIISNAFLDVGTDTESLFLQARTHNIMLNL